MFKNGRLKKGDMTIRKEFPTFETISNKRSLENPQISGNTKDMDPRLIHYSEQMQEQSGWKRLSKKTFSKGFLISWSKALE